MSKLGRSSKAGGFLIPTVTVVDTGKMVLPSNAHTIFITAAATASVNTTVPISSPHINPGRVVRIIGKASTAAITFTRVAVASLTANGALALGASTRVVDDYDVLTIVQLPNGAWAEVGFTPNSV